MLGQKAWHSDPSETQYVVCWFRCDNSLRMSEISRKELTNHLGVLAG